MTLKQHFILGMVIIFRGVPTMSPPSSPPSLESKEVTKESKEVTNRISPYLQQVTFPDGTRCVVSQPYNLNFSPVALSCNWDKTHE